MFKKALTIILALFLVLPISGKASFVNAEDEEETSEKSDREKCIEDKDEDACLAVANSAKDALNEIEKKIEQAKNSKQESLDLAKEFAEKAGSLQQDIDGLSQQIEALEVLIVDLQGQIQINEAKVEELNGRVKDRMVAAQATMHFNGYLDFILGAKSFSDMLRRIYGVEAVASKDKADRQEYVNVINKLNTDKKQLDDAKLQLDADYEELVNKQAELIAMKKFYEQQAEEIQNELDEMTEERDSVYESFSDLKDVLKEMGVTVNTGFVTAVHGSKIVAGVWHYDDDFLDGTWHLGVDYASKLGTELHAPAGGVIIRADCSCPYGYLGSKCGKWIAGGGNQVYLMAEVDGVVYGFMFFHLSEINVEYGDYVLQDEVIGKVGSSGSSTGPHCHIEMYKLGYGTLSEYLEMNWNATYSVGRGINAYNNRCDVKSAPCILNPANYLP